MTVLTLLIFILATVIGKFLFCLCLQKTKDKKHPDYHLEKFYITYTKFPDGFIIHTDEDTCDSIDESNLLYKQFCGNAGFKDIIVSYKPANSLKREKLVTWFRTSPSQLGIETIHPSRFNRNVNNTENDQYYLFSK